MLTRWFQIADKNDVQELKQLSKEKYTSVVSQAWNTEGFVQSIALMYTQTMDTDRKYLLFLICAARVFNISCNTCPTLLYSSQAGYHLRRRVSISKFASSLPLGNCKVGAYNIYMLAART